MFTVNNFSSVDVANESYVPDEQLCVNLVFMTGETYEIKTNLQNARLFEFSRAIKSHLDGITPIITFKYLNYDTGDEVDYDFEISPIENNNGVIRRFFFNVFVNNEKNNLEQLIQLRINGLHVCIFADYRCVFQNGFGSTTSALFNNIKRYYASDDEVSHQTSYRFAVDPIVRNVNNHRNNYGINSKTIESLSFHQKFITETSFFTNISFEACRGIDCFRYMGNILTRVDNIKEFVITIVPISTIQDQEWAYYTERFINGVRKQTNLEKLTVELDINNILSFETNEINVCIGNYINAIGTSIRGLTSIRDIDISITNNTNNGLNNPFVNDEDYMRDIQQLVQNGYDLSVFASALSECANIESINLNGLVFSNDSFAVLNNAFTNHLGNLKILRILSCFSMNIDDAHALSFASSLSNRKIIEELHLESIKMNDETASILIDILENNNNIVKLSLINCNIGITFTNIYDVGYLQNNQCIDKLCKYLSKNESSSLEYLDISCNPIWSEGLQKIAESIRTNTTLIQLNIVNSLVHLTHNGVRDLDVDHMLNFHASSNLNNVYCSMEQEQENVVKYGYSPCLNGLKSMVKCIGSNDHTELTDVYVYTCDHISSQYRPNVNNVDNRIQTCSTYLCSFTKFVTSIHIDHLIENDVPDDDSDDLCIIVLNQHNDDGNNADADVDVDDNAVVDDNNVADYNADADDDADVDAVVYDDAVDDDAVDDDADDGNNAEPPRKRRA